MYCRNCGKEIPEGSMYCSKCGSRQDSNSSTYRPALGALGNSSVSTEVILKITLAFFSGITIITAFLPWAYYDTIQRFTFNLIDYIHGCFSDPLTTTIKGLSILAAVFAVLSTCFHAATIYRAFGYLDDEAGSAVYASIFTFLVAVLLLIATKIGISLTKDSWMFAEPHYGAGNILCLVLSVVQFALAFNSSGIVKSSRTQSQSSYNVPDLPKPDGMRTCRFCGQKYMMNSANKCPHCGRSQSVGMGDRTTVCPHCKHRNPAGTVFCANCHAQIGIAERGMQKDDATEYLFCEMCGAKVKSEDTACPQCGWKSS